MTKTILTIIILVPTFLLSQTKKKYSSSYSTVDLFGGINLHNVKSTIVGQTNYVGLGLQYLFPLDPRHLGFYRADFRFTIPANYNINDTLSYKLDGFMSSVSLGAVYFQRNLFSLPISLGLNFGQTKLQTNDNAIFKNNNIAPKISIQPKLTFKRIYFGAGLEYSYDVSKSTWKSNRDNSQISNFNQTCISTYFFVGLRFT